MSPEVGSQLSEVLIDDFVDALVLLTPRVVVGRVLLCLSGKDTPRLLWVDEQHGKNNQGLNDPGKHEDLCGRVIAAQKTC